MIILELPKYLEIYILHWYSTTQESSKDFSKYRMVLSENFLEKIECLLVIRNFYQLSLMNQLIFIDSKVNIS